MIKYNFTGKNTIVTGATSGMGEGVARMLIEAGGKVLLSGRDSVKGLVLEKSLGSNAHFLAGDVSLAETNQKLVANAISEFGSIDHLVLCAGKLGVGKLHELENEEWESTIATNLNSVFYLLKYALPEMQKKGKGSIVIVGSIAAKHAFPNHPAYSASKSALLGLVNQVALDYAPQIRINLISPAQVDTPLLRDSVKAFDNPDTIIKETEDRLPMKRLGTIQDINAAVAYLLSDESGWITGTNLKIDGGFTI